MFNVNVTTSPTFFLHLSCSKPVLPTFRPLTPRATLHGAVAKGYSKRIAKELDATLTPLAPTEFAPTDLLIVSVPVYGSAVLPLP